MPEQSSSPVIPTVTLSDTLEIKRIVSGMWQVSGGHGEIDFQRAVDAMSQLYNSGFTSFDMADHYGAAEQISGEFSSKLPDPKAAQLFTKWCPEPAGMTGSVVEQAVRRALQRMQRKSLDLLQLHWWDYTDPAYIDAMRELGSIRQRGLIKNIGLTNFDAAHVRILMSLGVPVATNQVHYSLLDQRAAGDLTTVCKRYDIRMLCYGTLAGGFLSDAWVGKAEPSEKELSSNWSRMKYMRFIRIFGGWPLFQELLEVLQNIAEKHSVSISNVAVRWVLDQPYVAAVLVGARLGLSEHIEDNLRTFTFSLDGEDHKNIRSILSRANPIPGDCGDEYRKPPFLTASGDLSHHKSRNWHKLLAPKGADSTVQRIGYSSGTEWEKIASYYRAVRTGNTVAVSGTTASYRGNVVGKDDAAAQMHFCIDKIEAALASLGSRLQDVVRTRVYISNLPRDWRAAAQAHGKRFSCIKPANTLIGAQLVGEGYLVEVEADAVVSEEVT